MKWDYEVDVAVVGGGACGLMTALRAARNPALRAAVFEKGGRLMSNAQVSSGTLTASIVALMGVTARRVLPVSTAWVAWGAPASSIRSASRPSCSKNPLNLAM